MFVNIKTNGYWHRYSNTLLVSLNNRISMRELSASREALITSRTRPTSTASKDGLNIVHLEIKKPSYAFEERKPSEVSVEDDRREGVIGKCCCASFPVLFQYLDLIDRYRMIWISMAGRHGRQSRPLDRLFIFVP